MPVRHCSVAVLAALLLAPATSQAQTQLEFQPGTTSSFMVFLRGTAVGVEQVAVSRTPEGWSILSTGRLAPPMDLVVRKLEVRYTADWKPISFSIDMTLRGQFQRIITTVEGTTATTEVTAGTETTRQTATITPDALLILPNSLYSPFEALAAQLRTAPSGTTLPTYLVPVGMMQVRVADSTTEQIQTTGRLITAKRTHVTLNMAAATDDVNVWTDESGRLLRITVPAQGLDVARTDIASVAARQVAISRPNDEAVRILANGFSLAGTMSKPVAAAKGPLPAVILAGDSGPTDRDELLSGIPILGQLADALADAGFAVIRYDKRGIGQSGGRSEGVTLNDYTDDQRAAIKFLTSRKDIDPKRIAVVGHGEGGLVSLMTAGAEKRVAALVLLATPGVTGSDLVLQQQQHALAKMKISDAEKQARVAMQKRINDATLSGKGLDQFTADVRRQVEDPTFQSLLASDPTKLMARVHQPLLIVQGELDVQVAASNADRLAALAQTRKPPLPAAVVKVPGVNHLLAMAVTGEADEYDKLPAKQISPAVSSAVVDWLKKTLLVP